MVTICIGYTGSEHVISSTACGFSFLQHFHFFFFFDGASDVNVLAFMCSELMGQWSWGAVLACKSLFPSSFIILSMHHHVV